MSTLKTINISHPDNVNNNVVLNSSGNVNIDSGTFYVDAVNNRVGIGTTSPGAQLEVVGGINATDNTVTMRTVPAGTVGYFGTTTNHPLGFRIQDSEKARIDTSGRLLVGTSSARSNIKEGTDNETPQIQFETAVNDYSGAGLSIINNSGSGYAPQLWLGTSSTNAIGGNGLVGSGRIGAVSFNGADGTNFIQGARISAEIDGTTGSGSLPTRLVFATTSAGSPTERMRITNSGEINTYSTTTGMFVSVSAAAGTTTRIYSGQHSSGGTQSGTESFRVWSNGNVQNTNNSYGAISDIKLKENIVDASSQWDDIKALQIRNYNFKEGQTHTQIGLVAQEAELVSPGLVSESPDRDEDGNDLGTVTKSVNYSVLYMKAVKALQEAMERIEQLEAKVSVLESKP